MASRFLYVTRHGEADGEDGSLTSRGEEQARRLGRRLTAVPLTAISHSPLPRATQTARIIGAQLPAVELQVTAEVDDYVPPFDGAPADFAALLSDVSAHERSTGAGLAAAALARFAIPAATETHELIVTHVFQVAWFVRDALGAPDRRWMTLNPANCALTTILYRDDRPPELLAFNEASHLTAS